MPLSDHLKTLSHHAYYLIGNNSTREELITHINKKFKFNTLGNPDFFDRTYDSFTIDDARELKSSHDRRPVGEMDKKIFVILLNGINSEAQNALLKLLEEPSEYAHFFFIIPSGHLLLPTVKSRLSFIDTREGKKEEGRRKNPENSEVTENALKFIAMSAGKRLDYIKKLVEDISKEKKNRQDAISFLNEVEAIIYKEKGVKNSTGSLEAIQTARKYLNDRAPSVKMLLELVALNI